MRQNDLPGGIDQGVLPSSSALGFNKNFPRPLRPISDGPAQPVAIARSYISSRFSTNTVVVSSEQRLLIGRSPARNFLLIQNIGATDIWIGFGSQVAVGNGVLLPVNAQIDFSGGIVPQNEVYVVCATSGNIAVVQGHDE